MISNSIYCLLALMFSSAKSIFKTGNIEIYRKIALTFLSYDCEVLREEQSKVTTSVIRLKTPCTGIFKILHNPNYEDMNIYTFTQRSFFMERGWLLLRVGQLYPLNSYWNNDTTLRVGSVTGII